MSATDGELEQIVRAELAADAADAPSGWTTRQAVLSAVSGETPPIRFDAPAHPARRWAVPVAAAAVLTVLTAASLLGAKELGQHSTPAASKGTAAANQGTAASSSAKPVPGASGGYFPMHYASNTAFGSCLVGDPGLEVDSKAPISHGNRKEMIPLIKSKGGGTCTLSGYPDVKVFDPVAHLGDTGGAPKMVAAETLHGPLGGVTGTAAPPLTLAPGSQISAIIEWSDQPVPGKSCTYGEPTWIFGLGAGAPPAGMICDLQVHPFVAGTTGSMTYTGSGRAGPASCTEDPVLTAKGTDVSTQSGDGAGKLMTWTNTGTVACVFTGYPTVQASAASGAQVTVTQTLRGTLGGLAASQSAPPAITLQPGQSASAVLEWESAQYGSAKCVNLRLVQIGLGDAGGHGFGFLDSQRICNLQVHPVVPGTTGSG